MKSSTYARRISSHVACKITLIVMAVSALGLLWRYETYKMIMEDVRSSDLKLWLCHFSPDDVIWAVITKGPTQFDPCQGINPTNDPGFWSFDGGGHWMEAAGMLLFTAIVLALAAVIVTGVILAVEFAYEQLIKLTRSIAS